MIGQTMISPSTASDWYWQADDGRVFSSKRYATVTMADTAFKAWQTEGNMTSQWPRDETGAQTTASLQAVLSTYGLSAELDGLKTALKKQVDGTAEALRLTLITPGSGQAMEYQEAYAQAQSALSAASAVKDADYPMLAATVGVDTDPQTGKSAKDVLGVARSVKAAYEAFLTAGAAIRGARLKGKAAIEAASSAGDAQAAFYAISWPTLS